MIDLHLPELDDGGRPPLGALVDELAQTRHTNRRLTLYNLRDFDQAVDLGQLVHAMRQRRMNRMAADREVAAEIATARALGMADHDLSALIAQRADELGRHDAPVVWR